MRRLPVGLRLYCTPGAVLDDKNLTLRYLVLKHFEHRVLLVLSSGQRSRERQGQRHIQRVRRSRQRRRQGGQRGQQLGWQRGQRRAGGRWRCRGQRGSAQCGRGGDGLVDGGGVSLGDLLVGVGAGLVHEGLVDG